MTQTAHHANKVQVSPGIWGYARPVRDSSPWHRWRQERACRKDAGHCWHADEFADAWCCMCGKTAEGLPINRCAHCAAVGRLAAALNDLRNAPVQLATSEAPTDYSPKSSGGSS